MNKQNIKMVFENRKEQHNWKEEYLEQKEKILQTYSRGDSTPDEIPNKYSTNSPGTICLVFVEYLVWRGVSPGLIV